MSEDQNPFNEQGQIDQAAIDPLVTPGLFLRWRSPQYGAANPERMNNSVWEWLVKTRLNAYQATKQLHGPDPMKAGPGWCFDRLGQTSTPLPDGRVILIAGEHEDYYDPDFYIYNDVVVLHPDRRIDIWGYPPDIFPPTDFHSATLIGNRILIIGNLGYADNRTPGTTPVFLLDFQAFTITSVQTCGTPPGWIHGHHASLSDDRKSILIQRGKLDRGDADKSLVENIDDWRLHLRDWRWERLTERRWSRWEVRRTDGEPNHLFEIQQAQWNQQYPFLMDSPELDKLKAKVEFPSLEQELGTEPDLELFKRLYRPELPHECVPASEAEYGVHRIIVAGITVRYVEDRDSIQITVEGELSQSTISVLMADVLTKLSRLENTACELKEL